ncbi:hypothetical protein ABFX02_11G105700 [Erythranthe guttata]
MHWWQGAFASSSKSNSDDDSVISGDRAGRYSVKPGFFSSRRYRSLMRSRKFRPFAKNDVESWRSASFHSPPARSPSPQPLPMPELHVLLRRDPKFASSSPYNVPLPSPKAIRNQRGEERERDRERERHTAEALSSTNTIDGFDGLKRLIGQNTHPKAEHSENRSYRKSRQKQNTKERSTNNFTINIPISAPASPYSSPAPSPLNGDMFTPHYMTPPNSVFHVWSAPEIPHSDSNHGFGFYYQMPWDRTASSVDSSPLQSPVGSCPITRIPSETSLARRENSPHATVHPLPLPPGAGMSLQSTPVSPVASTSDFSQPNVISSLAVKPELVPIKSRWQKGKLIGRGTFGSVYVASNRETGALCAMKEVDILPDDSKSAESMRQLEQEIKVLSRLKHPNIVQYYGSEIVDDKFYIYLEYVHPGSINRFIHDHCGAITESVVRNFTRHILCGLAYLHKKNTIHRDIKGANLLVDAYGVVKLADFGMAKHLNGETANLSLKGSPYWLAPELLQSAMPMDASPDHALAVDIWSLGCTVIEMMDGKPPWSEFEGAAALFKVLKETPPIPETLSEDGKDFLQCCFRRNPAERPTASKLLRHRFVNYSQKSTDACMQSLKEIRLTV